MSQRTSTEVVTFGRPFSIEGVDRILPAGDYRIDTDESLIDGLSFLAWRRTATTLFLPACSAHGSFAEMVAIDPAALAAARTRDAAPPGASDSTSPAARP